MNKVGYEIGIGSSHGVRPFERACGTGSYPHYNREYCKKLIQLLYRYDIKKIVDYGCGNLEAYRGNISWTTQSIEYVGYDVNKIVLQELKKRYPTLRFEQAHLKQLPNEKADAIITKDLLIHWFDEDIKWFFDSAFDNFRYVFSMHSTSGQGYKAKYKRHAPHDGYGINQPLDEHFWGIKDLPYELVPHNKIIHKENIMGDSMKTLIVFDREA